MKKKDPYNKPITELTEEEVDAIRADIEKADPELDTSGLTREHLENLQAIIKALLNLAVDAMAEKNLEEGENTAEDSLKEYAAQKGDPQAIQEFLDNPGIRKVLEAIIKATEEKLQAKEKQTALANVNIFTEGRKYWPAYLNLFVQDLLHLSAADFKGSDDANEEILVAETKRGQVALMEQPGTAAHFLEACGPVQKKLLLAGLIVFASKNHYNKGPANDTLVELSLYDFADAVDRKIKAAPGAKEKDVEKIENLRKDFKREIKNNLYDLASMRWDAESMTGEFKVVGIIQPSFEVVNGKIRYRFDQEFADILKKTGFIEQIPVSVFKIKNTMPNALYMALGVANHYSNDRNAARGIESTLSIKSLISYAPKIQTFEELRKKGRRDWRKQIKQRLEASFEEYQRVGFWTKWQYRDPGTGATYNPETAAALPAAVYEALMVDYVMADAPDQSERRAKREEERKAREEKALAEGKPKKQRGRPKKTF